MSQFTPNLARNRFRLVRYAAPVVVLCLSVVCAYLVVRGQFDPAFILAGIAAIAAGGLIYRLGRFEYGLLAVLLAAGLINFFTLPTGRDSRVVISLAISLVLLVIWGYQLVFTSVTHVRLRPSPINKPLLAFVAVNIIAYVWSQFMRDPILYVWSSFPVVQVAALVVNAALPLMALLVSNKVNDVKWLKAFVAVLIGVGVLYVVTGLLGLPTYVLLSNGTRGLFSMWLGVTICSLALFHSRLSRIQRLLLYLLLAGVIYINFVKNLSWVSGWLPLGVACGIVVLRRSRAMFAGALLVLLVFAIMRMDFIVGAYEAEMAGGSDERASLWAMNLVHVVNHPFLGMGPAGYAIYNMTYHPEDARSTHNNYFDILAQTGVIGFVIFLTLSVTFLLIGWRTAQRLRGSGDFEEVYAIAAFAGCVGALVGMMLGDWVLPFAYNQTISGFDNAIFTWMMLGGGVALYHIILARANSGANQADSR